jgi:hypothetical protein
VSKWSAAPIVRPATGRSRHGLPVLHLVERREVGDAAQMGDAAGAHDRACGYSRSAGSGSGSLAIMDRVEDLADRERRGGVLADQA